MPESIEAINQSLFLVINAGSHPPELLLSFAWFSAEVLIYLLAAGLATGWLRGSNGMQHVLLYAGLVAVVALLINQLIGLAWYHPRPFEVGLGHTYLAHKPETSFPSDHATVFFSVALGLLRWPGFRAWALALIPISLLVAWSRVWLGVHYPLDMLGSLVLSGMIVMMLHRLLNVTSARINEQAERLFKGLTG